MVQKSSQEKIQFSSNLDIQFKASLSKVPRYSWQNRVSLSPYPPLCNRGIFLNAKIWLTGSTLALTYRGSLGILRSYGYVCSRSEDANGKEPGPHLSKESKLTSLSLDLVFPLPKGF